MDFNYILLVVSVIITLTYGLIRNDFSKKHVQSALDYRIFIAISSYVSTLVLLVIAVITKATLPSVYTLVLGIVFGLLTATSALFTMRALELGPMSYTSLITSTQLIIPALAGQFLGDGPVPLSKYIGVGLMLISIVLSVAKQGGSEKKASVKWLILCLTAMVLTGSIGVMQKIHQKSEHKEELLWFLIIAFFVSTVYSLIMMFYYKKKKGLTPNKEFATSNKVFILAMVCGMFIAFANQINLYLSGVIDSIIFFPVVNGAGLLLSIIASSVFLKEKLTPARWVGVGVGIVAIAFLCFNIPINFPGTN